VAQRFSAAIDFSDIQALASEAKAFFIEIEIESADLKVAPLK
jgi:hypothetical protein